MVPSVAPKTSAPVPATRPVPEPPKRKRWGVFIAFLLVAGAAATYWLSRGEPADQTAGTPKGPAAIRTFTVARGTLEQTIRLTGTTGAEKYVSLVTPQLRGSRTRGAGDARSYQASVAGISDGGALQGASSSRSSRSGSGSSGESRGGSSSGSAGAAAAGTVASTSSASGGASSSALSSAMRSATSRVSRPPTTSSSRSAISPGAGGSSSTLGAEGLGSTSSSLSGGSGGPPSIGSSSSGGGGGGGDFMLVLQELVKPGSLVKKGQTVAEFDRQSMLTRLEDYRSSVAQVEASVKKLEAELEVNKKAHQQKIGLARAELDKARLDVKTTPVVSAIEAERMKLALEEAEAKLKQLQAEVRFFDIAQKAQLRNAQLDLQQARVELKRYEANSDRRVIKTPINGLTVMQSVPRGSEVAQVQQGDQLFPGLFFMQIVDLRSMVINAAVNQSDVEQLRVGAKARVRFDAYPDLELPAHIYSLGAMTRSGGPRNSFVKEIPVRLKLDRMDPRVIPDLSVSVDVILDSQADATLAARSNVFRDEAGKPVVFVKQGEIWDRRRVELGLANNLLVTIRSGVRPGEVLASERPPDPGGQT